MEKRVWRQFYCSYYRRQQRNKEEDDDEGLERRFQQLQVDEILKKLGRESVGLCGSYAQGSNFSVTYHHTCSTVK